MSEQRSGTGSSSASTTVKALIGPDGEVHCAEVMERVNVFIDHEIDTASAEAIRQHLAACEACLDQFDMTESLKRLVHRCCSGEQAPDALRLRVLAALAEREGPGR